MANAITAADNKANPATGELQLPKGYKPMSVGQRRLEVPEKPGWHRHWFRGMPSNLQRAQQAGYKFVDPEDIDLNSFDLAGVDTDEKGTDLGTRVSVTSGDDIGVGGQPGRLYLMECPEALYEYAQGILREGNTQTVDALRGGQVGAGKNGETRDDRSKRYTKDIALNLFKPKS